MSSPATSANTACAAASDSGSSVDVLLFDQRMPGGRAMARVVIIKVTVLMLANVRRNCSVEGSGPVVQPDCLEVVNHNERARMRVEVPYDVAERVC